MEHDYDGSVEIERAWREGLIPDPLLTVSEWADRHRMLSSKASSEPGRWRSGVSAFSIEYSAAANGRSTDPKDLS